MNVAVTLVLAVTIMPAAVLVWALIKKKYTYKPKAKK